MTDKVFEEIDKKTAPIEECIVPVFYSNNSKPYFVGSSLYLQINDRFFLISAEHVLHKDTEKLILPISNETFDIIPTLPEGHIKFIKSDLVDIAFCELKEPLELFTPLGMSSIQNLYNVNTDLLIAVGFPGSKTRTTSTSAKGLLKKFVTTESNIEEYKRFNADKKYNIISDFNKKKTIDKNGQPRVFPDPNGMSGGGLFHIVKDNEKLSEPKLVGILTDWDPKTGIGMKSTTINTVLAALDRAYDLKINSELKLPIKVK